MLRTEPLTLAIVDDDEDVRTALSRLLRTMGHDVRAFASAEAFEAETLAVDCVIADVRLPGLSGLELRERLIGRSAPAPVVLVTGDVDVLARENGRLFEIPLVTKPFDADALTAAIADAIATAPPRRAPHVP